MRAYGLLVSIIFAGEIIFSLPFHVARFFRPTLLDALSIDNTALGDAFAAYGICAMLAYFPGGVLADRVHPRILLVSALFATALGGLFLAQWPTSGGLIFLFGYWGVSTIFLFWAAMIKVTRQWGGVQRQGRAFGLLDGGRGLVAAALATIAVALLQAGLPEAEAAHSLEARRQALRAVIYFYSLATLLAAVPLLLMLRHTPAQLADGAARAPLREVLRHRSVGLQALIVICAYCGYKGIDYYALFAVEVLAIGEVDAARWSAYGAYIRPVAAVLAGLAADRWRASSAVTACFGLLIVTYAVLACAGLVEVVIAGVMLNLGLTLVAVFALRAVYFALIAESRLPLTATGTAVGIISVLGFTPDVFFAPLAGRLLDSAPGGEGYQHLFALLTALAATGLGASALLARSIARSASPANRPQNAPRRRR